MIKVITECLKNYLLIWGGAIGIIVMFLSLAALI